MIPTQSGAKCHVCDREFSVYNINRPAGYAESHDFYKLRNVVRANAARHSRACAARRIAERGEIAGKSAWWRS